MELLFVDAPPEMLLASCSWRTLVFLNQPGKKQKSIQPFHLAQIS
jgi:hypothetical protein